MKKVVIIILCLFLVTGCSIKKVKELTDSEKFAAEYNINKNNPFIYAKYDDIDNILNTNGIIFFATPDGPGSKKAAEILNEVTKTTETKKIYYYNPNKIKDSNPNKYKKILKYLDEYLIKNKDGKKMLNLPIVMSVYDGKIVGYSNYLSKESHLSEEKLTKKKINIIKKEYKKILNYEKCSNCN